MSGPLAVPLAADQARAPAEEWVAAWNAHDLAAIIALYAPGVVFQTPTIIDTLDVAGGTVRGRRAPGRALRPRPRAAASRPALRARRHLRRGQLTCDHLPLGGRDARLRAARVRRRRLDQALYRGLSL